MTTRSDAADRIGRELVIAAPIERVWSHVAEPGWWIGGGERARRATRRHDLSTVVEVPPYGRFPVLLTAAEPPHYARRRLRCPRDR